MKNKRIFKACEIDCNKKGWIVDLSSENTTNPDCYWHFETKKQCKEFVKLIDNGWDNELAYNIIYNPEKLMNIVETLKDFQEENK